MHNSITKEGIVRMAVVVMPAERDEIIRKLDGMAFSTWARKLIGKELGIDMPNLKTSAARSRRKDAAKK